MPSFAPSFSGGVGTSLGSECCVEEVWELGELLGTDNILRATVCHGAGGGDGVWAIGRHSEEGGIGHCENGSIPEVVF